MSSLPNVAPVSGLSPSAAVPGVYQPPQTSATGSSVTTSPDVTVVGTLTNAGNTLVASLSGHAGVGVQVVSGAFSAFTLAPEVSFDGGTTYVTGVIFKVSGFVGTNNAAAQSFTIGAAMTETASFLLLGGETHVRLRATASAGAPLTVTMVTTAVSSAGLQTAAPGVGVVTNAIPPSMSLVGGQAPGSTLATVPIMLRQELEDLSVSDYAVLVRPQNAPAILASFGGKAMLLPVASPLRLGGTPFTLRATGTAGGFAPPIVTATQPPQTVMTFSGKIPGAAVNNYVLDAVVIRILGPAAVAAGLLGRVVKRHVLYASTQTAAPAAGAVPTGAALAYTGAANGGGTYQYKYVAVDIWGNEGNYSAASLNVAPAANNGVTVTCPAVPAGAAGYNIYRTVTGPGATWFFLGRTNTATFRDITPDSALTLAAGTIATWSTLPAIETVTAPMELVMEKFVALTGTAPVIISTKTFPGTNNNNRVVTIAPGAAVGRYRIPGEVEAKAFLAAPTITTALARDIDANYTYGGSTQINAAFGDIAVNSFNQSDAGMGGTFVVWGHELVGVTEGPAAAATAGFGEASAFSMKWVASPVFAGTDEIAIEIGSSITNNAVSLEIMVSGRYF